MVLRLNAPGPHVVQELLRDLRQDVLGQASHAQDVVAPGVDVIPERHKLEREEGRTGEIR